MKNAPAATTKKTIGISELVLRDGHQSMLATRMRTDDMLPICKELDAAGFWSVEVWGGATFDACVRFLREDPWERLAKLRRALPNARLQMLLRGRNLLGYRPYAKDIVELFVQKAADNGMDVFRIFDAMNDFDNMKDAIAAVKKHGKHAQGTVCYTTGPVHNAEIFAALAGQLADAGCDSIAIKDMAGIMTPAACGELTAAVIKRSGVPVHVHSHSTSGLAPFCLLRAAEAGAAAVDAVISPFAGGASHPPTETMHAVLSEAGWDTGLSESRLQVIADYFRYIRPKYWQFESDRTGFDPRVLEHHVPGGMISNLSNQLREQKVPDKMDEVLAEIPKVRADLGYPPLVTPTSQIVGAQAVLNIVSGRRYKIVSTEVKNYFLGHYGKIPGEVCAKTRKLAVGAAPFARFNPPERELEKIRAAAAPHAKNDEDILTFAMFPDIGAVFLQERAAGQLHPPPLADKAAAAAGEPQPSEFRVAVHGETYRIALTGMGHKNAGQRPVYLTIDGVPEEVLLESIAASPSAAPPAAARRPPPTKPGHVTAPMPSTVVAVHVKTGGKVKQGAPLFVVEAMKMETEIYAPVSGAVLGVLVEKGDQVGPDEVLVEIEPDGG
ncbi:MAG: pyruvate carboxylase subunit B [Betaproteobacteria bacterium]|nr:pyruvate carboxylase subunit B [Betaproteobacteria bacterium]